MASLVPKQHFANWTVVVFLPHFGQGQEWYRVADTSGNKYYLSLGNIEEAGHSIPSQLKHESLLEVKEEGSAIVASERKRYRVFEFISAETLFRRLERQKTLSVYDSKNVACGLLSLVDILHRQSPAFSIDGLSPSSILLGLQDNSVKVLDIPTVGIPLCRAPESIVGKGRGERSDIYVVGSLLYRMLFGQFPWKISSKSSYETFIVERMVAERRQPLSFPERDIFDLDDSLLHALKRALAYEVDVRYERAADMLFDLESNSVHSVDAPSLHSTASNKTESVNPQTGSDSSFCVQSDVIPSGLAAVAGMRELKEYLTKNVINLLNNKERARRYRIQIPNGILLYGPPGCGKSFFAEKFAEEVGYIKIYVKASDVASIYVHGAQCKIKELFDEARKKAPTVICFDEFDALVPNRNNNLSNHQYGEVNEFLSQLNNCGEDGVFVIASTNKPDLIDFAVMRRGRIDRLVYLPAPDEEARRELFLINLKGRPCSPEIDILCLAKMTEGYVCSDIAGIVNDAAIVAAERDELLTQQLIERIITSTPPTVSRRTLDSYEQLKQKLEMFRS